MKKTSIPQIALALLLSALPAMAQTAFFTDNFSTSTLNGTSTPGGTPTASSTSYDIASTKAANSVPSIAPNDLKITFNSATTSGFAEAQAVFTSSAVALAANGDYVDIQIVFTNTANLLAGGSGSTIWLGLYSSGGAPPVAGALNNSGLTTTSGSSYATGNCAGWAGYFSQITSSGATRITTRPIQNGSLTDSADQELLGNALGGGAFANPGGTTIETAPSQAVNLTTGATYTENFILTVSAPGVLTVTNVLYSGVGTGGAVVVAQGSTNISGANYLAASFDGLAIGVDNKGTSLQPIMDVASITINGQTTIVTTPPDITVQPASLTVATNGYAQFSVTAVGFDVGYQWHRNGGTLSNGGDISGATASTLVVSPSESGDAFSGVNGYYCTVSGLNGYTTNTVTNSLSLVRATNLIWAGSTGNTTWDIDTSADWVDTNGNPQVFTSGDPVTLNDTAADELISLSGNVGPSSVTVSTSQEYTIGGSGSLVGPASVLLSGSGNPGDPGEVVLSAANTYSGGTTMTNAVDVILDNYAGLGTGPVNLDDEGGTMEITNSGSSTTGINGPVNVGADYTIQIDGTGTYATVFESDLSGTAGKTLTFSQSSPGNTNRYRLYGVNTLCAANIDLQGGATTEAQYNGTVMAPYGSGGTQMYTGTIFDNGGLIQRGNGTTILTGPNTYSGGTTISAGNIAVGSDSVGTGSGVSSGPIGTGYLLIAPEVPNTTGSGTIMAYLASHTVGNTIAYPSATNNQVIIIGGTNNLTFSGPFGLNGLDGQGSPTNRTIQVTNTAMSTFSGVISDGGLGFGLTKTGPGALSLHNTETYTGPTTVSAGALLVDGQLNSASTVNVATNGTLGGVGTVPSAVTVQNGGTVEAGDLAIGTLTVNNTLTFSAGSTNLVLVNGSSAHDQVNVSTVAYAGTLFATNLGASPAIGTMYTIFNATTGHSGNFTTILGTPGPGLAWSFNSSSGVLSVIAGVPPLSALRFTSEPVISGTSLDISGTNTGAGTIYLLTTTNLAPPVVWTPIWTNVLANSSSFNTNLANAVGAANKQQFYWLTSTNF